MYFYWTLIKENFHNFFIKWLETFRNNKKSILKFESSHKC